MKFVGSKNRLSKHLKPIIESYITDDTEAYIEPFVGGANMIDKIDFNNKIGYDANKYLISLLNYISNPNNELPTTITREEYNSVKKDSINNYCNYPYWYVGLVGFCATYNAKWFGGYAGKCKTKQGIRHYDREAIRNIEKQRENLYNIKFRHIDFREIEINNIKNSVIYCDIPYKNKTSYREEQFPHDEFYKWCKKLKENNNVILISEYNMPDNFKCIWGKPHKTSLNKNDNQMKTVEKLFIA